MKIFKTRSLLSKQSIIMAFINLAQFLLLSAVIICSLQSFSQEKPNSTAQQEHPCNIKTYKKFIYKKDDNNKLRRLEDIKNFAKAGALFKKKYGYSCDLQYANLKGADLRWVNLQYVNLKEADLRWANLNNITLRGADLRGANFRGADMRYADVKEANLSGTQLRWADLRGTDFRGADMRHAYLRWSDMSNANLRKAQLKGANLREADLREADLREADLRDTYLRGLELKKVNLREAIYDSKTIFPEDFYFWTPWLKGMIKN